VVLHRLLGGVGPDPERSLTQAAARTPLEEARARGLSSATQLSRALKGDLSAIVRTCLQEGAGQRYPTVNGLAEDLRAWLAGAPVSAQNPTRAYVLRKFARRNRWGVAAAAVLLVAVVAGVAGVVWQAGKARKAAAEAQAQLDYLSSLLKVLAPSTAEARELNRSRLLLDAAAKARSELADKPASLAGVEFALAQVAVSVSDYRQAIELADSAAQRRASLFGTDSLQTAEAQMLGGLARLGLSPPRFEEAGALLDTAIATARARAPGSALLADGLRKRSTVYSDQDKLEDQRRVIEEAAQLCEGALATNAICEEVWLERGSIASRARQPKLALPFLHRAYEARRARLGKEHADTLQLAASLAWAMADEGDAAGGLALAEETRAANQKIYTQPTEISLHATLIVARLLKRTARFEEAEKMIDEYVVAARKAFGDDNQNTILGFSDHASLLYALGRFDEAAEQFGLATRGYTTVKSDINAAITQGYMGDSLREAGHAERALGAQRAAVATMKRLYPKAESVMLARALANLAFTELASGQAAAALAHDDEAVEMMSRLQPGASTDYLKALRGWTLLALGRGPEAERELRASVNALAATKESAPNQYWEPFAYLTQVACANHATDCEALRAEARGVDSAKLSALIKKRLADAVPAGEHRR
jgi:serine/threonine-protein kinase